MRVVWVAVLLSLTTGCSVLSASYRAVEERLQRDDVVFEQHGVALERVQVGDARSTVHEVWGQPRRTKPRYDDIEIYLALRNESDDWRVLPGEYNDLQRTTPLVVKLTYVDDHVTAVHLIGQAAYGNSRRWCDDISRCGELFPFHVSDSHGALSTPFILTTSRSGFDARPVRRDRCEIVVFPGAAVQSPHINFIELRAGGDTIAYMGAETYHVSTHRVGPVELSAWPNDDYRGVVEYRDKADAYNTLTVDCAGGERRFVQVALLERGFLSSDVGVRLLELSEADGRNAVSGKRAIRSALTAAPETPGRTARLQQ